MKKLLLIVGLLVFLYGFSQERKVILPDGHSLLVRKVIVDKQGRFMYSIERQECIMWHLKTGHRLDTFYVTGGQYSQFYLGSTFC